MRVPLYTSKANGACNRCKQRMRYCILRTCPQRECSARLLGRVIPAGELNPEAPTHESMEKVLAVSKTQTLSAGSQQVAALLEQLMYDLFALRLAPLTDAPEAGGAVEGRVHNPHDVYLQCVSEGQATAVFRMLLQLLHNGAEDTKRLARDALQWLSMNTQVAFIEAGALKPLVEILGTGAAPAVVQMLADSVVAKEGVGVVDAARALRTLATDNGAVAGMAAGCIKVRAPCLGFLMPSWLHAAALHDWF